MVPATRRSSTRAAETEARKARLLDAAVSLAGDGGYEAVQMRDVAGRAEVALGTLYRHYASKDQLLVSALAAQAESLEHRLQRRPPAGSSPAERVATTLDQACRALERRPRVTAALVTALTAADPEAAAIKRDVRDRLVAIIHHAIDGATPADDAVSGHGVTRRDGGGVATDVDSVARVLGYVWFAVLTTWVSGLQSGDDMRAELARAAHLLLD